MNKSEHKVNRSVDEKKQLQNRLRRIEGQVRGIQKMIEEDRYCVDILIQLTAINSALKQVGMTLLESHTNQCVSNAIMKGEGNEAIKELMKVVNQFTKT